MSSFLFEEIIAEIMDMMVSFILFISILIICLICKVSMLLPIALGVVFFSTVACRRGFSFLQVMKMGLKSVKNSLIVVRIMILIGCMTGLWRASGTIAYFVHYGVMIIPEKLFILACFLLTSLMSFALGTSFGITATSGVILMAIARTGGVNPILAAGAILSGVYVGDRGSPAASSANLVAVLTGTDMRLNVRLMLKDSVIPFLLCVLLYGVISIFFPMEYIDISLLHGMEEEFSFSFWCLLPAIIMLILPLAGVKISYCMLMSIVASFLISVYGQEHSIFETIHAMLFGFVPENDTLLDTFGGGGLSSMLEVSGILILSGSYGGIFKGAGLLKQLDEKLEELSIRFGRFTIVLISGVVICMVFCNQTIGIIMLSLVTARLYGEEQEEKEKWMLDIENSVVVLAGIIPWCIACSVPLGMLGVDYKAVGFAFYLYLIPICSFFKYCIKKRTSEG